MCIPEPEQLIDNFIVDGLGGVVQSPGCQAYRTDGVLFRLVQEAEILEDYQVSGRVLDYIDCLKGGV